MKLVVRSLLALVFVILFLATGPGQSQAACVAQPADAVSWWQAEDNGVDNIGANDGTMTNGATFAGGLVGRGFSFDGVDDHLSVPDAPSLRPAQFSVAAWVNPAAAESGDGLIVYKQGTDAGGYASFVLWLLGNTYKARTTMNGVLFDIDSGVNAAAGVWTHLAVTNDGSQLSIYVDGILRDSVAVSGTVNYANYPILIGNHDLTPNIFNGFNGRIDEVEVFARALSAAEVAGLFNAGEAGVCASCTKSPTGMTNWWGGDGNGADMIGTGDGTLFNGTAYGQGVVGQAFSFDGVDDYIAGDAAQFPLGNVARTVTAWVRTGSTSTQNVLHYGVQTGVLPPQNFHLFIGNDGATGKAGIGNGWGHGTVTGTSNVADGKWHFIAGIYEGPGTNIARIYVDGVEEGATAITEPATALGTFEIGRFLNGTGGGQFNGMIDEVAVFSRALSAEEMLAIYQAGGAGMCRPCAAQPPQGLSWWRGEGNPDDYYGLNNATLVNGAAYGPGKVGEGFALDGTDDYAQVQTPVGLPTGNAPRSMDLWFKTPRNLSSSTEAALVQYGTTAASQMFGLIFSGNCPGKLYFYGHSNDLCGTTTVQPDTWYHGAVTYDGATLNLYLNGRLENSMSATLGTVLDANGLTIGARPGGALWQGELDEVRIHTSALSAGQIEDIYNAREAGVCGNCVEPPTGMTNWWGGDGNGADMQGTDDGILVGNTTYGTGMVGQAFSFDGAGDYVQMADVATGDFGAGPFTVDFWLHANAMAAGANYYLLGKSHPDGGQGWDLRLQDSTINVIGVNGWPAQYNFRTEPIINTGQWHHAAMVSDGTTVELYVDGELTGSISRQAISTASNPFRLGFTTNYGGAAFNGLLDEVEIFDRALTPAEVRAIFSAGREGKCRTCAVQPAGAVSLWKAENNPDDSFGVNPGTLSNGATYAEGRVGQAFSFDGADDYVFVPDSLTIDGGTQASYASWVYPEAAPAVDQYYTVLAVGDATLPTWTTEQCRLLYWRTADSPAATAKFYTDCGTNDAEESYLARFSAQSYPINAWHSVVVVFNNGELDMYVNGVLDNGAGTNIGGPAAINTGANNYVAIGAAVRSDQSLLGSPFRGRIDEVEIFSQALSASEIQDIYNAREAGVCIAYTVSASAGFGGSLDPGTPSPQYVSEGATAEFIFNADTGFHVAEVTGCGISYTNSSNAVASYTATTGAITGNCEISATFAINQYTATASAGAGGSLDPGTPSPQTVDHGSTAQFTFNAATGYHVAGISGCGISYSNSDNAVSSRTETTAAVTGDCTVNATFAINQYTVSAAAGANGSLDAGTPSPQTIDHGSTAQFTFNAATDFHVVGISGCGISYSNSDNAISSRTETTAAVTADCTVNATFAINTYTLTYTAGANGSVSGTNRK